MTKKHIEKRGGTNPDTPALASFGHMDKVPRQENAAPLTPQINKIADEHKIKQEFGDPELGMEKQQEIFLRGIVHDANNSLMAILAACDQLEFQKRSSIDPKETALNIRTQVKSISSLMRDILANRNMDRPMKMEEADLKSFLKGILPSLSLVAGHNTKIELGDFSVPPVIVHPLLLHRVLLQLIRNVSELKVDYPLAFITARRLHSWCEISVSDNGPGVDGIDPDQMFLSGYTSKAEQGTRGYGLSAVAWAVENWGGEYGVDYIAGDQGCRFWVRLPLWETD